MLYKNSLKLVLLASILLVMLQAGAAFAQDGGARPVTDDELNAVARQLYCPVCENIPLDTCPTQACAEWRDLIRLKLSQGWTPEEVKSYFVEQYGDRVLAAPPAHGFNWLVYILPPLVIAVGAYVLYRAFKAWKQPEAASVEVSASAPSTGSSPDPYLARLEEELKNR